jgi:hypothetical protein
MAGVVALLAGLAVLAHTVLRFAVEGYGTPAPVAASAPGGPRVTPWSG